jgi:hypothetical protein
MYSTVFVVFINVSFINHICGDFFVVNAANILVLIGGYWFISASLEPMV